jgi:Trk K+ transport system NAD-binding subunit
VSATEGPVLLIGDGDLADEVEQALEALEVEVVRLCEPSPDEVEEAFERGPVSQVAVVSGEDAFALRMALMVRHVSDDAELLVTVFDPTTAAQLESQIERCRTTSMADIVAPVLAGPCLDETLGAIEVGDDGGPVGVRADESGEALERVAVEVPERRRLRALASAILRPYDKSAALLLFGALGLAVVLLVETAGGVIVLGQSVVDAFYGASKTLVTVDPNDEVAGGPTWFKTFVSVLMLVALVFEALFTAGIVNRLIDRRLTGLVGRRSVPRRDHVVVIGLGQVGVRLCLLLRRCGIGVVAVDDREDGENVGHAREQGLPVVIGRGADPSLLRRLSLDHACALAAVTADDLENVSIAMAALSVRPDLRVVLRVGDGRLANETRSLFRVGLVRDVHRIAAAMIAAQATGSSAARVICHEEQAHLVHDDGRVERAAIAAAA